MDNNSSFHDLMARLEAGSESAATRVFDLYARQLIALARRHLNARIRQKTDPEDVMQSVFKTFFTRQADGQYDLKDPDSLWRLLALITVRKCANRAQHWNAEIRNIENEVSPPTGVVDVPGWDFISREPSPEAAAILTETMEEMMRDLDERDRKIVELWQAGYPHKETAMEADCAVAKVKRVINRVRIRLRGVLLVDEQT